MPTYQQPKMPAGQHKEEPADGSKQRLVLFLDGTWNNEDDSTNVRHAFHLTHEGKLLDGYTQRRYYDRGVGTGMFLDTFIGGGLGYGLEKNVREAYNWLVDNYNEDDEVYILGFSRGAYTARSLVGLIAACGLVRRGAPLTITQLWEGYGFISQNRSEFKTRKMWESALAEHPDYFRRISDLARDKWSKHGPGFKGEPINESEMLLREWSRRIQITYLGVFDTVGALGVQALGIPGLKSKLANSHNQYPSGILKSCRHALAVDENRSSFRLTPILSYVPHWPRKGFKDYEGIISQRWFIGAHSNIGGGYANNAYAHRPLEWLLEGAEKADLHLLPFTEVSEKAKVPALTKEVNDSFTSFIGLIWPHVLREKRYHRPIGRAADVRTGYSLVTVHEEIDPSVFELLEAEESYNPPNLLNYIKRSDNEARKKLIANRKVSQKWPGDRLSDALNDKLKAWSYLAIWATVAALGMFYMLQFFWVDPLPIAAISISVLAAFYVFVDWSEARTTLDTVRYPEAVIPQVVWNVFLWMRLLGVLASVVGFAVIAYGFIHTLFHTEISLDWLQEIIFDLWSFTQSHLLFPLLTAGGAIFLLDIIGPYSPSEDTEDTEDTEGMVDFEFDKKKKDEDEEKNEDKKEKGKKKGLLERLGLEIFILIYLAVFFAFFWFRPVAGLEAEAVEVLAGRFLLLHFLLASFAGIYIWMGKPMGKSRVNLGNVSDLQWAFSRNQLTDLFNDWGRKMVRGWTKVPTSERDYTKEGKKERDALAWFRTQQVVRIALWRDLLGFVPIYTIVFLLTFYLGSSINWWPSASFEEVDFTTGPPRWLYLVIGIALLDVLENRIHLYHLEKHPTGGIKNSLVLLNAIISWVKNIGFLIALVITFVTFIIIALEILNADGDYLRWSICILLIYAELFALVYLLYLRMKR